jgi:hypothetical protein
MSSKTIKVNPLFLSSSGNGGAVSFKNKTRKEKPTGVSLNAANNIKKKLISRIKNFQQESSNKGSRNASTSNANASNANDSNASETSDFSNEFSDSVKFLDDLARNKEEDKKERRNTSLKKRHERNPAAYMQIATELPPELDWNNILPPMSSLAAAHAAPLAQMSAHAPAYVPAPAPAYVPVPAPPVPAPLALAPVPTHVDAPAWNAPPQPSYGNLKTGGTKPTYRTWLRTTQKKPLVKQPGINILNTDSVPSALFEQVDMMPHALTQPIQAQAQPTQIAQQTQIAEQPKVVVGGRDPLQNPLRNPHTQGAKRKRVTRTVKYKLGKHSNGTVSVLIKNSQTRRKIQTEHALLKQKSILDVKNFLRGKNLLKAGSAAPNDVVRQIYEQSILAGQVENKAKDTLIHNYFNAEK